VPNWEPIVRQTFRDLRLSHRQCDEVIAELCAHLEDRFEELRSQKVSEGEAFEICLKEVTALHDRKRLIQRAKNEEIHMNRRTKTLWLPGFVSLTTASLLLMFVEYLTFFRSRVSVSHQVTYAYLAWLLLLPFCGAAGGNALWQKQWNALSPIDVRPVSIAHHVWSFCSDSSAGDSPQSEQLRDEPPTGVSAGCIDVGAGSFRGTSSWSSAVLHGSEGTYH
jgi:hypothetical protein